MFEIIGNKISSQDVGSFCKEHKIAKASYYYWLKKFREHSGSPADGHGFARVHVQQSDGTPLLSLQLPSGHVINAFHPEAFQFIASLLR
jgi:hypothetical protein